MLYILANVLAYPMHMTTLTGTERGLAVVAARRPPIAATMVVSTRTPSTSGSMNTINQVPFSHSNNPQPVPTKRNRTKYRASPLDEEIPLSNNIMYDRRVVRGNTYQAQVSLLQHHVISSDYYSVGTVRVVMNEGLENSRRKGKRALNLLFLPPCEYPFRW